VDVFGGMTAPGYDGQQTGTFHVSISVDCSSAMLGASGSAESTSGGWSGGPEVMSLTSVYDSVIAVAGFDDLVEEIFTAGYRGMEISGRFHFQGTFGMNSVAAVSITAGTETISLVYTEQLYNSPTLIDVYQNFSLFVPISAPTLDWWVDVPLAIQSSLNTEESLSA